MGKQSPARYARRQRRELLKLALLLLPALFWSAVFMTIAGVGRFETVIERVPDAAPIIIALMCPLLAIMLGQAALRQGEPAGGATGRSLSVLTMALGVALFVFAVIAALGPA